MGFWITGFGDYFEYVSRLSGFGVVMCCLFVDLLVGCWVRIDLAGLF